MHCTSVGKVILAHLPIGQILAIKDKYGLPRYTEQTITDKESFLHELRKIKSQGFGTEVEENEQGITCIAAPIFDNLKKITAAVSISGPSTRMSEERLTEIRPILIDIGKKISNRLGYTDN